MMFRKRNRTILEETLTNIGGIDVHSDVGRALLNKMIECGHLDDEVIIEWVFGTPILQVYRKEPYEWLASIEEKYVNRSDGLRKFNIWYVNSFGNKGSAKVYSKYDIYGKLITGV